MNPTKSIRLSGARTLCLRLLFAAVPCFGLVSTPTHANEIAGASIVPSADWPAAAVGTIDASVLTLALQATSCATRAGTVTAPATLTVIDYSKPSTSDRMWVFDLTSRSLMYQDLVAHGQGSGDNLPTEFSNQADTHRS